MTVVRDFEMLRKGLALVVGLLLDAQPRISCAKRKSIVIVNVRDDGFRNVLGQISNMNQMTHNSFLNTMLVGWV